MKLALNSSIGHSSSKNRPMASEIPPVGLSSPRSTTHNNNEEFNSAFCDPCSPSIQEVTSNLSISNHKEDYPANGSAGKNDHDCRAAENVARQVRRDSWMTQDLENDATQNNADTHTAVVPFHHHQPESLDEHDQAAAGKQVPPSKIASLLI